MIDLAAYFARIGYAGPTAPTLETLSGIVRAHVETIPFENLDVLRGRPIALTPAAIQEKLVESCRGGYCFEQNGLLLLVLESLGFQATPLSARVRYQRPRDYTPPRTHLFVRVEIDGRPWIADVGVGGLSLTSPIRLELDVEQPTPHETRRVVRCGAVYMHQVKLGAEWADVCEFTGEEMPLIDRELANWFTSTHPQSHFKGRLIVARALPGAERLTIDNREISHRRSDGRADRRVLRTPEELLSELQASFGLRFDPGTTFPCPGLDWPTGHLA
ncbi:MAG: arylamine N-acetyltransferase [Vicinamibacterales bacterium]